VKFLVQGFREIEHDRQTDTHTDSQPDAIEHTTAYH